MNNIDLYANEECFYSVLGCHQTCSEDQLRAEFHIRILQCHPDKKSGDVTASLEYNKLMKAYWVLMNERNVYDKWKNSGIKVSYEQWKSIMGHCCMHWSKPSQQLSLENVQESSNQNEVYKSSFSNPRETSSRLTLFRNYKI
ncbi:J domain-containing protein isoform X1 [Hydra vulgaris]|uniref:J domain-containing protein isoform X1 n=1 Tax=Hydra vulgaris TaxID=6087 RepID=UPI001F5EBFAE|nr:J domain-containing protein-like [Hydra vulgaris]